MTSDSDERASTHRRAPRFVVVLSVYAALHLTIGALFVFGRAPGTDAALFGFPLDDAWIHVAYARSAAGASAFAFTPGHTDPGATSPLWLLLESAVALLFRDARAIALAVKVVGVALGVATSVLAHGVAKRLSARESVGWIAGGLVAIDPELAFAQVSGMEVMLAAACLLAALLGLLERRIAFSGTALALGVLARPECLVLAACVAPVLWQADAGATRERARRMLGTFAPTALAIGGWALFCWVQAGRLLPNAWYVKHHASSPYHALRDAPQILGPWLFHTPWFFGGVGLLLIIAGARRHLFGAPEDRSRVAMGTLIVGFPAVFLLSAAWAHTITDPHAFYFRRYWLPILPWVLVLVALGAPAAVAYAREAVGRRGLVARVACAAMLVIPLGATLPRLREQADRYAWNCQNIEEMHVEIAAWVRERTAPGEWIAAHDVGALRVFGERPILDLTGLQDHRMPDEFPHLRSALQPRYTVVFPSWFPRMVRSYSNRVVLRVESPRSTLCEACDQDVMVVLERRER